jgi:hypothetical protein
VSGKTFSVVMVVGSLLATFDISSAVAQSLLDTSIPDSRLQTTARLLCTKPHF